GPGTEQVHQGPFPQGPGRSTELRSDSESFAIQRGRNRGPGHRGPAADAGAEDGREGKRVTYKRSGSDDSVPDPATRSPSCEPICESMSSKCGEHGQLWHRSAP